VYDVYIAFNPNFAVVDCLNDGRVCRKNNHCAAQDFWNGLNTSIISYFKSTTIGDLAKKQVEINQQQQELIFHI
jgi:DNA-binding IscR family transcriptional regulator